MLMFSQQMYAKFRSTKDHARATLGDGASTQSLVAANSSSGEAARATATVLAPKPPAICAAIHLASKNVRTHMVSSNTRQNMGLKWDLNSSCTLKQGILAIFNIYTRILTVYQFSVTESGSWMCSNVCLMLHSLSLLYECFFYLFIVLLYPWAWHDYFVNISGDGFSID